MGNCWSCPLGGCTLFQGCGSLFSCEQCICCPGTSGSQAAVASQSSIWRQCQLKKAIKRSLVSRFKKIKLPIIPWLKKNYSIENYTKLELQHEDQNEKGTIIELQNIFDDIDNDEPKRILIESQPGFGKTTLAHKIVSDWVKEEKYVKRFKFAILVILRKLRATTLQEELAKIINIDNCDDKETWNAVNNVETLLVLDGLDEVGKDARQKILEILYDVCDKYKMTIVVTCRIGLSQLEQEELTKLTGGMAAREEFWSKKVTILGITEQNRDEFLRNFVADNDNKDAIMRRIQEIIETRKEMFESPLLLILLVYVMRVNYKVKIKTNTDLYENLVECIIRGSFDRKQPKTLNENLTSFISENKVLFYNFGQMALDHIVKNELQFDADDKTEVIHQLGFLTKHQTETDEEPIIHYEGFHLSILEYAAALFMSEEFRKNDNKFPPELIERINELCKTKKSTSLVIPFLCGLLRHNVSKLFEQLSPSRVLYWINQELIELMINECEIGDSFGNSLKGIAPPFFEAFTTQAISTINHKELRNCFECVIIDSCYVTELTHPIEVSTIIIAIFSNAIYKNNPKPLENFAKYLKCNTLCLVFDDDLSYDIMAANITLFDHVCCKRKNLHIRITSENTFSNIEKCVENGILTGKEIDNLQILYDHHEETEAIVQIVKNNRINHLMFCVEELTYTILDLIYATPSDLKFLWVFTSSGNDGCSLDLDKITKSGAKEWNLLRFQNVSVKCNTGTSLKKSNCIKSLLITGSEEKNQSKLVDDTNTILSTTPSSLHCNFSVFQALCTDTNADLWKGWETIEYLILSINDDNIDWDTDDLFNFSRFKKLSSLTCDILIDLDETVQFKLSQSFKFLKLARLEIRWLSTYYCNYVIDGIRNLIEGNQIPEIKKVRFSNITNSVLLTLFSSVHDPFDFKCAQSALQSDDRISFRLIFYNWNEMTRIYDEYLSELSGFYVKYSFVELDPIDSVDLHLGTMLALHLEGQHVFKLKLK